MTPLPNVRGPEEQDPGRDRLTSEMEPHLNDTGIRIVGIPAFGIVIPNISGLFGLVGPADPLFWVGSVYFVVLSGSIWQGNRFFLLKQRRYLDWFRHPARKVMVLLAANVLYTAPLTVVWLWLWYEAAGFSPPDFGVIQTVTLMNVICVIFVTHVYETVYLIRQREDDQLHFEKLERSRAEAELEALRSQIDPHFMFNSLNTLAYLIETRPDSAKSFCDDLADVYRYILRRKNEALVHLAEELEFANRYAALMKHRFRNAVDIRLDAPAVNGLIPPISIQVLLENAVKHNAFSETNPLRVIVAASKNEVTVENDRRPLDTLRPSSQIGLRNLNERFELLTGRRIEVDSSEHLFRVTLPLIQEAGRTPSDVVHLTAEAPASALGPRTAVAHESAKASAPGLGMQAGVRHESAEASGSAHGLRTDVASESIGAATPAVSPAD